jgi:two-component system capsular synthesis response regulator RcsB
MDMSNLSTNTAVRVIVADDHPVVLLGARASFGMVSDIAVVGEAADGDALMRLLSTQPCDVLITDFSMPGGRHGDGLQLLDTIRRRYPRLPVGVLTMVNNAGVLRAMQSRGALCLVDKRSSMQDLPAAVRHLAVGKPYISESIRQVFERGDLATADGNAPVKLSAREMEVVRLYVGGLSLTQIADRLSRSVKTVSRQKRDAMRKLGVDHDSLLADYAREHGIV